MAGRLDGQPSDNPLSPYHSSPYYPRLERAGDAAVLADTPEVDRHQEGRHQRQKDDVQRIEADQGVLPDLVVTAQHQVYLLADEWGGTANIRADRDRPESQLIPGQQVAG